MPIGGRELLCPYMALTAQHALDSWPGSLGGTVRGWRSQRRRSMVLSTPSSLPTGVDRKTTALSSKSTPWANFTQVIDI